MIIISGNQITLYYTSSLSLPSLSFCYSPSLPSPRHSLPYCTHLAFAPPSLSSAILPLPFFLLFPWPFCLVILTTPLTPSTLPLPCVILVLSLFPCCLLPSPHVILSCLSSLVSSLSLSSSLLSSPFLIFPLPCSPPYSLSHATFPLPSLF